MVRIASALRDTKGATAAEFVLVLPLLVLLLLGTIDAGRFMWNYNRGEKAAQIGARMAVVTDLIPSGLATTSYVGQTVDGVTLTQGDRIPAAAMGTLSCTRTDCTCKEGTCPDPGTVDSAAFDRVVTRMQSMMPQIEASNVAIEYRGSGLGFAGDPNGSEISPLVTVVLTGVPFQPITQILPTLNMSFSTTLTAEDLSGSNSF